MPFVGGVNAAGNEFIVGPQNDYNFNPLNLFQSPLERFNIYGQARYQISSAVEAYAEAMFVKSIVEVNLAPAGVFGSALQVPLNSPFLSAQQRGVLCNAAVGAPGGLPAGADCTAAIAAGAGDRRRTALLSPAGPCSEMDDQHVPRHRLPWSADARSSGIFRVHGDRPDSSAHGGARSAASAQVLGCWRAGAGLRSDQPVRP